MANLTWVGTTSGAWTVATNWLDGVAPVAGDNIRIPASSTRAIDGSDQTATALGYVIVEEGYGETIGSSTAYLILTATRFEFAGSGKSYISLAASAISIQVLDTATIGDGEFGLYLLGSALATVNVIKGQVAIAGLHGQTATVTTARASGSSADLTLGAGVTVTTVQVFAGKIEQRCPSTTTTIMSGELHTTETGAITTLNAFGGTAYPESTGTITTLAIEGGVVDFTRSAAARTVTTTTLKIGSELAAGPAVTFTNTPTPPTDRNWRIALAA